MIRELSYGEFTDAARRYAKTMDQLDESEYRSLSREEIEILESRGSTAGDWGELRVRDGFDPAKVSRCRFYGQVRIGRLDDVALQTDSGTMALPVGLNESTVVNSRIGDNSAVYGVSYLSGYVVEHGCLLKDIGELSVTDTPSFGEMGLKEAGGGRSSLPDSTSNSSSGPASDFRAASPSGALEVGNENGKRAIYPFRGMWTADAHLWTRERGRPRFIEKLEEFTKERIASKTRHSLGHIGPGTFIHRLDYGRDLIVGEAALVEGAVGLTDCSIASSEEHPTYIGGGVELAHGIVGYGCRIETGAKAEHFFLADATTLSLGVRVSHTFLGENSTISCCEVSHALLLPFHEQHHNSSFLIAATLEGQANIAAGATIGSNHSSRKADGELLCRRGFWPALTVSVKHPSSFASFTLLAKEDYPHELRVRLPFSLVSRAQDSGELVLLPAFWFLYNRYALERNGRKFRSRDRRPGTEAGVETGCEGQQGRLPLVYDPLAPDTAEEIIEALHLLAVWTAEAWIEEYGRESLPEELRTADNGSHDLAEIGHLLLATQSEACAGLDIRRSDLERSKTPARILKLPEAYYAYRRALLLYAVKILTTCELGIDERPSDGGTSDNGHSDEWPLGDGGTGRRGRDNGASAVFTEYNEGWVSIGGSLFLEKDKEELIRDVENGKIASWEELHLRLRELSLNYHSDIINHAFTVLLRIGELRAEELEGTAIPWSRLAEDAASEQERLSSAVRESREKDFSDPFRSCTFSDKEEMEAVLGNVEDDPLIEEIRKETEEWKRRFELLPTLRR